MPGPFQGVGMLTLTLGVNGPLRHSKRQTAVPRVPRISCCVFQAEDYNLLIIGVPNVGKSSLINLLRRVNLKKGKKATRVAPEAGVTRSVLEKIKVRLDEGRQHAVLNANFKSVNIW